MSFDALWCLISWGVICLLTYFDVWYILMFDVFWCILMYFDVWCLLKLDVFWHILMSDMCNVTACERHLSDTLFPGQLFQPPNSETHQTQFFVTSLSRYFQNWSFLPRPTSTSSSIHGHGLIEPSRENEKFLDLGSKIAFKKEDGNINGQGWDWDCTDMVVIRSRMWIGIVLTENMVGIRRVDGDVDRWDACCYSATSSSSLLIGAQQVVVLWRWKSVLQWCWWCVWYTSCIQRYNALLMYVPCSRYKECVWVDIVRMNVEWWHTLREVGMYMWMW